MCKYLIAHDLGTSGNKATLFAEDGRLVKSVTHSYDTHFYNGNWAEQNPLDWWNAVCVCNYRLLDGIDKTLVAGVAFSGQMMGCVPVGKDGELLRSAIIWADQRSVVQERELRNQIDELAFYHIVGHKISASYSLEKLMWIRDNQPELFKQTYKMLLPKDYIIYRLTGEFVTDYSDASGTNAFDLLKLRWSEEILQAAGIDPGMLPTAYPSTHIAGAVSRQVAEECGLAAGTQIVIGGGDGVCASVGAASVTENVAYNYLGSSSWIAYTAKQPVFDSQMRTFNWAHLVPGLYSPTGTMQAAGNSLHFMKELFQDGLSGTAKERGCGVYQLIDELIAASPPGANGLLYLPYLLGERSPRWDPNARGAFIGLKMEHTKADLLRATVEGVLMNLDIILNIFRQEADITSVNIIGGLAKGAPVRKMLADIYGIPACRLNYLEEATSIGAAVTAGVGTGVLKDFQEVHRFIKEEEWIEPDHNMHTKYEQTKQLFDDSYFALREIFARLAEV